MSDAEREALIELFTRDLREKADSVDDPAAILWLALHASAGITMDVGPFERHGVKVG
jgi:hypothetical protein